MCAEPLTKSESRATAAPIRLALVITELFPGGAERCLVELACRIDRRRFSPVVYSLASQPPDDRQSLVQRLKQVEVPAHFLNLRSATQYFSGARQLAGLLREQQAEIVQTFLFHANVLGARAARLAGSPYLVTNIRVADPRWWRSALERFGTVTAERIVCVSDEVKAFCRVAGFAEKKLVVIPNGIDITPWRDARPADLQAFGVPAGRRVFLYVGRLDEQKGLAPFFGELPAILRELPEHDFLLVGDGKLKPALLQQAARSGIAQRVLFAGWQPAIHGIMAAADLLVLPSRWEGMPNVILEAMACGRPVVASRAEGVASLLGDSAEAQTAPPGDFRQIGTKIMAIVNNQQLAKDLGQKNQARAAQEFSLDAMIQRYEREYSLIVGR